MNWITLRSIDQLEAIRNNPEQTYIIFKHSTRCPVSGMAKRNIEYTSTPVPDDITLYFLDLIAFREISNAIAEWWGIKHESPQLLLIKGDQCIYHASHSDIDMEVLLQQLA